MTSKIRGWSDKTKLLLLLPAITIFGGCKKNWLDEKPNLSFVVPSTVRDYQALLDNTGNSVGGSTVGGPVGFNMIFLSRMLLSTMQVQMNKMFIPGDAIYIKGYQLQQNGILFTKKSIIPI
jgi:hypothetical protein